MLDGPPVVRFSARPQYPAALRALGVTGTVVVEFIVDASGNVANAHAVQTTLSDKKSAAVEAEPLAIADQGAGATEANTEQVKLFEEAAVEAVKKWKYKAGTKGGREVNSVVRMPVTFSLNNSSAGPAK